MQTNKLRILSVDGGGVKGILPIVMLIELDKRLKAVNPNSSILSSFDYFAGTSTGALLLALHLTGKYTSQQVLDIYIKELPNIFKSSLSKYLWSLGGWEAPEYDSQPLNQILKKYCSDLQKPLIVPAYNLDQGKPHVFITNREPAGNLVPILMAATAAPTFFTPASVENCQYIDGGTFANNPSMLALIEASKYHGLVPLSDTVLVSLSCGQAKDNIDGNKAQNWGKVGWIRPLINILMDGNSQTVDKEVNHLFTISDNTNNYFRFDPPQIDSSDKMDDTSGKNIKALIEDANLYLSSSLVQQRLKDLVKLII